MKIFFLVRALSYGGAERQLVLLSKGLQERGHAVVIAVFYSGGPLEKELRDSKVRIRTLNKWGRWDVFGFLVRLIQAVREERPDVIHGYLSDPNLVTVILKLIYPTIKVVWGIRYSNLDFRHCDWLSRLSYKLNCWLSRFPDAIIVNSHMGRDWHLAQGYPGEKIVVIPNGVDTERFHLDPEARRRIRCEWGVSQQDYVVGLIGRLSPIKDHPNFLRATALLARERKDVRLVCIGDGSAAYRQTLQVLAEELGLRESLIWNEAREDMSSVYNAMDVVVSSSYSEGLSNVIGEAMACGVPCVVTNVGDSAWLVGDRGEVVPPKDPLALKNAIERLLDQKPYAPFEIRQTIIDRLSVSSLVANTERTLNALVTGAVNDIQAVNVFRQPPVNP